MSHPIRKWLKDLLQYGRRSVHTPGEKPPLLWAADLPRLGQMWLGHCWFRTWLDLRQTPPRVTYDPREVFSHNVQLIRPTVLNPIRPLQRLRDGFAAFQLWLEEGGLERAIASIGRGFAGGVAGAFGVLVLGLFSVVGAVLTGIVGLFGASALGTALGLNALGRGVQNVAGKTQAGLLSMRDDLAGGFAGLWGRFRSPREMLWTFATVTGTVGLILLMVHQTTGLPTLQQATAADAHTVRRPPTQLAQAPSDDDPFGGLPDPFGPAETPQPPDDGFADPFGKAPVDLTEPPNADLELDLVRAPLPPDVARFNLPDNPEEFLVESDTPLPDVATFPVDKWLLALPRRDSERQPVVPAAYREMADASPTETPLPEPSESADRFIPATRSIGVTIRKTQPDAARPGELLWYDLIVTNHGDEAVAGLIVEERVAEPHRVADAHPAASYDDGVLTWRLDGLGPGEERRLGVAVYPMSAERISTAAAVRPIATFSAVTLVQAEEPPLDPPLVEEPPLDPPAVEPPPVTRTFRRIKIVMTTPEWVRDGSDCVIRFEVTNTGTAPLTGVAVRSLLPSGLTHPNGGTVESQFGPLAPGETRSAAMHVRATTLGEAEMIAEVSAAEGVATTVRGSFGVVQTLPGEPAPAEDLGPAPRR